MRKEDKGRRQAEKVKARAQRLRTLTTKAAVAERTAAEVANDADTKLVEAKLIATTSALEAAEVVVAGSKQIRARLNPAIEQARSMAKLALERAERLAAEAKGAQEALDAAMVELDTLAEGADGHIWAEVGGGRILQHASSALDDLTALTRGQQEELTKLRAELLEAENVVMEQRATLARLADGAPPKWLKWAAQTASPYLPQLPAKLPPEVDAGVALLYYIGRKACRWAMGVPTDKLVEIESDVGPGSAVDGAETPASSPA